MESNPSLWLHLAECCIMSTKKTFATDVRGLDPRNVHSNETVCYITLTAIMALLGGCLILTTWPQDPKPSSPRCSRSCMLLKYRLPSTVMIPVSLMISCSLASISACLEFVEQLVMFIPAKSKFRLTLVGVPFGCRGTEWIYKDNSLKIPV